MVLITQPLTIIRIWPVLVYKVVTPFMTNKGEIDWLSALLPASFADIVAHASRPITPFSLADYEFMIFRLGAAEIQDDGLRTVFEYTVITGGLDQLRAARYTDPNRQGTL